MLNESNIPLEEDGIEEEILVDEEVAITKAMWGDVGGNIENQTDLQNALDAKQDSLTEAQLNAVNSGITSEKVTTYDGYADQIASKADQSALNAETIARGEADTALGTRIDNEALARQQTDNGLQSQIDAITSKSDVVDVVANYAALQAYDTSTLGNNDVVKVLDDETHEDALTYYRWSTTTQTWSYIGQEAPYYSKGQMDVKLAEKQDKLTAGANIQIQNGTISATDTTYTAGNGLNLNGTEFSADTDVLATKEDLEGYYTKPETDNLLAPKLEAEVVTELPTTGAEGKLYLTPKAHTTSTATGNPIEATVTEQAGQLESFQLDGDTYQQTYSGKNLLAFADEETTRAGIDITWQAGKATLSGKATSTQVFITDYCANNLAAGTYTFSMGGEEAPHRFIFRTFNARNQTIASYMLEQGATSVEVTISGTEDKYRIVMLGVVNNTYNETDYFQLESGSTASDYEPFVGGQPSPSPEYPQQIQTVTGEQTVTVVGKNLFNVDTETNYFIDSNGNLIAGQTWSLSEYIKVSPNTTYVWHGEQTGTLGGQVIWAGYDSSQAFISGQYAQTNNTTSTSFTTGNTTEYIRVGYRNDRLGSMQLELGSATSYEPYSKQTLPINLGSIELCKLATYQDYIWKDRESWKVHKEIGYEKKIVSLAGIDGYSSVYGTATTSNGAFAIISTNWGSDYATTAGLAIASSVIGVYQSQNIDGNNSANSMVDGTFCQRSGANDRVYFRFASWARSKTVNEVNQMITDNGGIDLWYPLATSTDTVITDQTLIAQLEAIRTASLQNGANTITNTATGANLAGDMEIGYFGFNPNNRYDKWLWLDLNNNYEQIGGE